MALMGLSSSRLCGGYQERRATLRQVRATTPISALRAALLAASLLLLAAFGPCGGGGEGVDSPRAQEMAAFITAAADRWATQGAGAFWDTIVEDLKAECSRESFVEVVSDELAPVTFKQLKDVDFNGSHARAQILFVTSEGDKTIEWQLFELQNGTWRIEHVPGMEDCRA